VEWEADIALYLKTFYLERVNGGHITDLSIRVFQ
jgi:hypothetical protein